MAEPPTPGQLTPAQRIPPPGPETPIERILREQEEKRQQRMAAPFPGQEGGRNIITQPDGSTGFWARDPVTNQAKFNQLTGPTQQREISPFQQAQLDFQQRQFQFQQQQAEQDRGISPFEQQQFELQQRQVSQQQSQFQAQLAFQQQQAQQQAELQRQAEMARLAANPINWLQFAAFTGEQPVIQPWMIPLGFQQFGEGGGTSTPQGVGGGQVVPDSGVTQQGQLQAGQPLLPQGGFDFSQLPQLRDPSAQFLARLGPTGTQQFLGFERARTGASPQETQFRQRSGAAPTGRFGGFSRFR
ncbi:hypothetical protein LCGC14_0845100 [marine sediment metagenome]|uniref:Uncharacterized protein n=1 Tax=marine sediment metagenome TaxID=412755 RepID=A0A0F9PGU2_9ZZZZ